MQTTEFKLDIGGRRLAVVDHGGAGEPLLALHGWLDNAASFHWLAPRIQGRRLLALELAGHGHSDWKPPGSGYPVWDYLQDLDAALDALGLERVHLLGHSLGAGVAALFAAIRPGVIASLVMLEGAGPLTSSAEQSPDQLAAALNWHRKPLAAHPLYPDRERMARARARGRYPVPLEAARMLVERGSRAREDGFVWRHDPQLLAPSVMRLTEEQVDAFLARIRVPTLACMTSEGIIDGAGRKRLQRIPGARLVEIDGSHHPQLEPRRLDALAAVLNDFYATVTLSRPLQEVAS